MVLTTMSQSLKVSEYKLNVFAAESGWMLYDTQISVLLIWIQKQLKEAWVIIFNVIHTKTRTKMKTALLWKT